MAELSKKCLVNSGITAKPENNREINVMKSVINKIPAKKYKKFFPIQNMALNMPKKMVPTKFTILLN